MTARNQGREVGHDVVAVDRGDVDLEAEPLYDSGDCSAQAAGFTPPALAMILMPRVDALGQDLLELADEVGRVAALRVPGPEPSA